MAALLAVLFTFTTIHAVPQRAAAENTLSAETTKRFANVVVMYLGSSQSYNGQNFTNIDSNNHSLKPYIQHDRTYVPLRFLTETFGGTIEWKPDVRRGEVRAKIMGTEIIAHIGEDTLLINGQQTAFDAAPEIRGDRLFVPVRVFVEALGKKVFYHNGIVIISGQPFDSKNDKVFIDEMTAYLLKDLPYHVYRRTTDFLLAFATQAEAIAYASTVEHAAVRHANGDWLWGEYPKYIVYQNGDLIGEFAFYDDALRAAQKLKKASILNKAAIGCGTTILPTPYIKASNCWRSIIPSQKPCNMPSSTATVLSTIKAMTVWSGAITTAIQRTRCSPCRSCCKTPSCHAVVK